MAGVSKQDLLNDLPPEWPEDLFPQIQEWARSSGVKLVVLDDDPTGTQTVREVTVLTRWEVDILSETLQEPEAVLYILTNSRSMPLDEAEKITREIIHNLKAASQGTGRRFSIISRSDSTLRGHFPEEVQILIEELGVEINGILIIPFFAEGGRLTIQNIHYVAEGEQLVPAGVTDFAKDPTFGYTSSDLRMWVHEKSKGEIDPEEVAMIDHSMIRLGGPGVVAEQLSRLKKSQFCVVNAASYRDLEVVVAGLIQAEAAGKRFVYRTAASFVRVIGGIEPGPYLTAGDLGIDNSHGGGLVVAGSYVRKSSEQIAAARTLANLTALEAPVPLLLESQTRREIINQLSQAADSALNSGEDVLIYTSRELITGEDAKSSLQIGKSVSEALVDIVRRIHTRPAWVVAKGGITSSDVATSGLGVRKARVRGQLLPGVPVWQLDTSSRWPGLIYVVFPGNVGGPDAIAQAVIRLRGN